MDSIFEEDADEVGGEIEAYCPSPRCKADTTHTIISMYEDEVRRVQCVVCGEVHAYRKPRGDGVEEAGDGAAKKASQRRMTWDDAMARATETDLGNCRPYSIRDAYEEGDVVHHPVFDIGFVIELLPDNKVEVIFRDGGSRILVHNRGDLAARMPDISEIPIPREAKKKKRAKKPEPVAQPLPTRSKAEVEAAVARARAAAHLRMDEAQKTADERSKKLKAEVKKGGAKAAKGATPAQATNGAKAAKPPAGGKPPSAAKAGKPPAATKAKPAKAEPAPKKPAPDKPAAKKPAAKKPVKATPAAKKPAAKKPAAKPAKAKKPAAKKPAAKPAKAKPAKAKPAKKGKK
jgi:Zn ribbon nucleic-acid-binding protein